MKILSDVAIPIFHGILIFFMTFYGFITKKVPLFDYMYLFMFWLLLFHWTFLNGECIISYAFKKIKDSNYVAGQTLRETEYTTLFSEYTPIIKTMYIITNILTCIGIYIVSKRNNLPLFLVIPFIVIHEIYYYGLYFVDNHCENKDFLFFQEIIKYMAAILFLLVIYYHKFNFG